MYWSRIIDPSPLAHSIICSVLFTVTVRDCSIMMDKPKGCLDNSTNDETHPPPPKPVPTQATPGPHI